MAKSPKKKKPATKPKRRRILSKSTKVAKGKKKKPLPRPLNQNLIYYQKLRSHVSDYYKSFREDKKAPLDRKFLTSRTKYAFSLLTKENTKITDREFKRFVARLHEVLTAPSIQMLEKDKYTGGDRGFECWNIEYFLHQNRKTINEYNEIIVDGESILGAGNIWTGSTVEEINTKDILRECRKHMDRHTKKGKKVSGYYLWFIILVSKEHGQYILELVDNEPEELVSVEKPKTPIETPPQKLKKEPEGKKETPQDIEEQKPTRTGIESEKRAERLGNIEAIALKKKSYQDDIAFNNSQIKELISYIEAYKKIGVDATDEVKEIGELKAANKKLKERIDKLNDELDKI